MKIAFIATILCLLLYACATPVADTKLLYDVDQFYSLRIDGNDTLLMRRQVYRHLNIGGDYKPPDTVYFVDKAVGKPVDIISYKDKAILVKFPSSYMIATYFGYTYDKDLEWKYFKTKQQFNSYAKKYFVPLERTENW